MYNLQQLVSVIRPLNKHLDQLLSHTLTLMSCSTKRQYGWFWNCCISAVISATFLLLLKFMSFVFWQGKKSGLPSSINSILVKYIPADKKKELKSPNNANINNLVILDISIWLTKKQLTGAQAGTCQWTRKCIA